MLLWERRRESLDVRATCETIQETTRVGGPGRAAVLNFLQQWKKEGERSRSRTGHCGGLSRGWAQGTGAILGGVRMQYAEHNQL